MGPPTAETMTTVETATATASNDIQKERILLKKRKIKNKDRKVTKEEDVQKGTSFIFAQFCAEGSDPFAKGSDPYQIS